MKPLASISAKLFRADTRLLGEGSFWHARLLWWVDIERGLLCSADAEGNLVGNIAFGQKITAAAPVDDQIFLVAFERQIILFNLVAGQHETISRPLDLPKGSRFNDGKCDPAGRWIIGRPVTGNLKLRRCTHWNATTPSGVCEGILPSPTVWLGLRTDERCTISIPLPEMW